MCAQKKHNLFDAFFLQIFLFLSVLLQYFGLIVSVYTFLHLNTFSRKARWRKIYVALPIQNEQNSNSFWMERLVVYWFFIIYFLLIA